MSCQNARLKKIYKGTDDDVSSLCPHCVCRRCAVVQTCGLMEIFKCNTKAVAFLCIRYNASRHNLENHTVKSQILETMIKLAKLICLNAK